MFKDRFPLDILIVLVTYMNKENPWLLGSFSRYDFNKFVKSLDNIIYM